MKNIGKIAVILLVLLSSCKKDFEDINTNPNSPTTVEPSLVLRQVIYNVGDEMAYEGFVAGNVLGQYYTMVDFNLFDRHSLLETQYGGNPWPTLYKNMRDNNVVLEQAQNNEVYKVYEGPALILKAYLAGMLTDIYGDIPYSDALKGSQGNIAPKYDKQEDIYKSAGGIIDNLNKGIASINGYAGAQSLNGDILCNGDLNNWIKFANSLKIKYLIRMSDVDTVSGRLQSVLNSGLYLKSNIENATFDFTDGQPNNFRMAKLRDGDFNLFVMSLTAEEILNKYNDPRRAVLYKPISSDSTGMRYEGLLNGQDASATSVTVSDYSLGGTIFRENTARLDANFMTAWETELLLAEAAQKGLIASSPQMHYDNGVTLAFEYWGATLPSTYLTTDSSAFGNFGANTLEQIITQKWIANSINGYESWIEYRRTGFPQLKQLSASLNSNLFPVKMPYPTDEATLNSANFNAATGGDNSVNKKVWWDVF